MRRLSRVGLAFGLLLAATACGSGQTTYTLPSTKSCLVQRGAHIGGKLDFVASTAPGGAFVANLSDNWTTVVFGDTLDEGQQIQFAYERFAKSNVRAGLPDVLKRYANTVTLWHKHPSGSDLSLVVGCLK